ncbi:gephyrin-like molybdotransferase Glp [Candidatus Formimonas warabiya]|uniref:Molybdopterin molybdenumtransferase n=1 Tax=Formimonas warabiya TaxID=1761012 RepID=A0A3G1KME5_FORW1|nr:gephyrin-like molybdotransferase Glp [Candidatus Formimonas warabiya]ATW23656.1 molybdopterin molybdenumtransferase MoeA [Candidatus Formimonas warabiya]
MRKGISLEEAQELLLQRASMVEESSVPLMESLGRILSRDIRARENLPSFDKSPLDGYALQAKDVERAELSHPVSLEIIEEVRAGFVPQNRIRPGTAIKVMTGTPIPEGADTVIKYEDVKRRGNFIYLASPLRSGNNIIRAGEDVKRGEVVATKGTLIRPGLVGLLAGLGMAEISVYQKVKVALVSTGDELIDPVKEPSPGKIYNSSLYSIAALCGELGVDPVMMGIVPDEKDLISERILKGLEEADILISTGGVSVGDFDVVQDALRQIEADLLFWKVSMKPGSPVLGAEKNKKIIIGLSGNPAAALVTFDLIAVPVIKKMMGLHKQMPPKVTAVLMDNFSKPSPQRRFLRGKLQVIDGLHYAKLTGEQGNGILKSMVHCNALIDVPAGSGPLSAGQEVSVLIVGNIMETFIEAYQEISSSSVFSSY